MKRFTFKEVDALARKHGQRLCAYHRGLGFPWSNNYAPSQTNFRAFATLADAAEYYNSLS